MEDWVIIGGGFSGGTTTYKKSDGDLYINGTNFRGVNKIILGVAAGANNLVLDVDPSNPPAGVSFSADGTRIIIDDAIIPVAWEGSSRAVQLTSVGGLVVESNSTAITVSP